MKSISRSCLVLGSALLLLFSAPAACHAEGWKAGAAKVKITPTIAVPMAGFGNRTQPAQSASQDLWTRALVLEDPKGHRAVLIMLDLVGIDRATSAAVCATLHKKFGLARDQICLNCSHTHCGPAVGRNLSGMFFLTAGEWQRVDEYTTQLREKIVEAVAAALGRLAPATLSWSRGTLDFAVNRRNNPPDRVLELRSQGRLKGPSDYDVPVLKVASADGRLAAVVGLYACHATILAFAHWSGDWPGYGTAELEKAHPGAIAFYCAGCGGDQTPWPRAPETVERAAENGRRFAKAVEAVLEGPMASINGELATSYREIDLRLADLPPRAELEARSKSANRYEARRAKQLLEQIDAGRPPALSYPYPVQVWRLGTGPRLVALGGEVVVDYALRLKKELGRERTWVAGYSNDVMAYIPSRRVLAEGGYEGGGSMVYYGLPTVWAPRVEEDIVHEVRAQAGADAEGEKWTPLFNGRDLTGWRAFVDPKEKVAPEKIWSVRDGAIRCEGSVKGYLATEKEFENYQLRLEWRWGQKVTHERGSSVFVHVTGPNKIWPKGADVTLGAGGVGQFWLVGGFRLKVDSGRRDPKAERHYFALRKDAEKPLGEWNQCDITCRGGTIRARINGVLVNEGADAEPSKGRIILLSEGAEIHFRKIEMKALKR